jgi:aryl-alcohol dehydrogenase
MRVRAAVCREGAPFPQIETLQIEPPRHGEILVRLAASGICHTDLRAASRPGPKPIVLGHEGAGMIEAVGEDVDGLEPGDPVLMSYSWCGQCPACRSHAKAYCRDTMALNFSGLRADGTSPLSKDGEPVFGAFFGQSSFASHAICQAHTVVKAPRDLPLEVLAPLGCGVQTGAGAVLNSLKVEAGQSLAVFGVGPVGLSAVMAGRIAGAGPIIAVDVNPARLALALELGASAAVNAAETDPVAAILDLTAAGADVALNTTDIPEVYLQGLAALAPKGVLGFVTGPRDRLDLALGSLMLGGKSLRGIIQGDSEPAEFIPRLIEFYRTGQFPVDRLVSPYPFDSIAQAMHDSEAGTAVKPVLLMQP